MKQIYLAGGCFWGTEHFFKQVEGVKETEVGYANGNPTVKDPTYEQVYTDTTGYAETVRIAYDEEKADLEFLLNLYFMAIDPTSINQQGEDKGTRYRTGIYYTDENDLSIIKKVFSEQQQQVEGIIQVEVLPLRNFYPAEDRHQDYLDKNPEGYCHLPLELFKFAREARMKK